MPQVKNAPLATALNNICDPAYTDSKKKQKNARGGRGGRGRGGGRGGGRGSAYSSAANSRASSVITDGCGSSDGEDAGEAAAAGPAASAADGDAPAIVTKQWLRAPQSALERAAGELAACGIAVGCRRGPTLAL